MNLKSLELYGCNMLQELQGLPTSSTVLDASKCPLDKGIPDEIGSMSALKILDLSGSKIHFLPTTISQLMSLKSLKFYGCEMLEELQGLPTSLTVLEASCCPLDKGIPDEIGSLSALKELDLSRSNIRFLPATFSQLTSLKSLRLYGCEMFEELRGLPTSLTVLAASSCPLDKGIPDEIGSLSALERLNLLRSKIHFLPATVSQLTSLMSLTLEGCEMLEELRGLPTSLTMLATSGCPLDKGIPDEIGSLSSLERLDPSGSKIRFLPATVSQLTSLKFLNLSGCEMLQELRGLPTNLTDFEFSWKTVELSEEIHCRKEYGRRSIIFSGVLESRLKTLGLSFSNMASLHTCVQIRNFTLTEMELGGLDSLPSLTELSIDASHSLIRVSNIGRLRGLRLLKFNSCRALVEIPRLEQLEMLEELEFGLCHSICGIQDLLGLKRLKIVNIWDCSSLLRVPRLIDECCLSISCCDKLRSFMGRYSVYEGESSKIQLEDDSWE